MTRKRVFVALCMGAVFASSAGCGKQVKSGQLGGETNWFAHCGSDDDCQAGECTCGICTSACSTGGDTCAARGACSVATTAGYQVLCAGTPAGLAPAGVCAAECENDRDCTAGNVCTLGVCVTAPVLDSTDPCAVPEYSTNEEAIAAVQCKFGVPDGALVYVKSNSNGVMHADGRSWTWLLQYLEAGGGSSLRFDVSSDGVTRETGGATGTSPAILLRASPGQTW